MSVTQADVNADETTRKAAIDNVRGLSEGITELRAALRATREKIAQLENDRVFHGPAHLTSECDRVIQVNNSILSQTHALGSHKHRRV
jgi:hypothetical protein